MPAGRWHGSERELVRKAAVDPAPRQILREELRPHVIRAVGEFMRSWNVPKERERELIEVGMEPFDRVFGIYLKNAQDRDTEEGHFYAYYLWWMRKAISEHLHSEEGRGDVGTS